MQRVMHVLHVRWMHLAALIPLFIILFTPCIASPQETVTETYTETYTYTETITNTTVILVSLPQVYPLYMDRIVVYVAVGGVDEIVITLVGYYSTDPTVDLMPVNIRLYDNETDSLVASIYYSPYSQCFGLNVTTPPEIEINETTFIHYGRWVVEFTGDVSRVEVYKVNASDISSIPATCPGSYVQTVYEEYQYIFSDYTYVIMPKPYEFPPEIKRIAESMFLALFIAIIAAVAIRGDVKIIGLGMTVFGAAVVPFLYIIGVVIPNVPAISALMVITGLLILWMAR